MPVLLILAIIAMLAPAASAHQGVPPEIVARIPQPLPGHVGRLKLKSNITLGRKLFEKETFGGNGRTCATCHAAKENFALSPADVRRRPAGDALFVFERFPGLEALENGQALRSKALIIENVDGFDQPGVLRSVPHIFGLSQTINPESNHPLVHATGWGGDGSPGDGSLRQFAVGAVVQHFTKSLVRTLDVDFRMPTAAELEALEAFQLSIGRQSTPVVDPALPGSLVFLDGQVTAGQILFAGMPSRRGTRRCSGCHTGAGALNDVGENEQRANGNEVSPDAPTCFFPTAPGDGGFGLGPIQVVDRSIFCTNGASGPVEFRGNRFFSTQTAIEAADTLPAFHDNSANSLEEVVDFYRSDVFNNSITGAGNGFLIDDTQRDQIALFLRVLNVLENIRNALAVLPGDVKTARRDVADAVMVLSQGTLKAYQNTALPALKSAQTLLKVKQVASTIIELERARGLIAN
jgi:cytochrome c peroxidase